MENMNLLKNKNFGNPSYSVNPGNFGNSDNQINPGVGYCGYLKVVTAKS